MNLPHIFPLLFALSLSACQPSEEQSAGTVRPDQGKSSVDEAFKEYWFSGEAELSRYQLKQRRYGEIREGNAVTVFVTEPFLTESQVKKERKSDKPSVQVLKLNLVKEFTTGIYDYDMMTSVFHQANRGNEHPLKMTSTSQEWCGQTFMQLNRREGHFRVRGFSYFQDEGDVDRKMEKVLLEDELFTRLRIAPSKLPTGKLKVLPSAMALRLLHLELEPLQAEAEYFEPEAKDSIFPGEGLKGYELRYRKTQRHLRILYEKEFPHNIAGWEEWTGEGEDRKLRVRAVQTHQMRSAYWEQNAKKHHELREKLGLGE